MATETHPDGLSKSKISKAGSNIRKWARGEITDDAVAESFDVVDIYRDRFPRPLLKVNNGLRSFTSTLGIDAVVSQRLKRFITIVNKLTVHESKTDLARLQDIGGCRVVCGDVKSIHRLQDHINHYWDVVATRDYIETPRSSGYRALHIIVERDAVPIEIQLRTHRMHQWAQTVEVFGGLMQTNYKTDSGDELIQRYMRKVSQLDQIVETNRPIPIDLQQELATLSLEVRSLLEHAPDNEPH